MRFMFTTYKAFSANKIDAVISVFNSCYDAVAVLSLTGAEFVILLGMRKLYDVKIKTLPFDYL